MTQSIIVYRNPAEEAIWSLLMSSYMIPIYAGFLVFIVGMFAIDWFVRLPFLRASNYVKRNIPYQASAVLAVLAALFMYNKIL